jgi:hypothetical protein
MKTIEKGRISPIDIFRKYAPTIVIDPELHDNLRSSYLSTIKRERMLANALGSVEWPSDYW